MFRLKGKGGMMTGNETVEAYLKNNTNHPLPVYSFMRKMDGGGSVFFQASALAGWVCQNSRRGFEKIQESLGVRGSGMTLVREGIEEWGGMMEDGEEKGRLQGIRNDIG